MTGKKRKNKGLVTLGHSRCRRMEIDFDVDQLENERLPVFKLLEDSFKISSKFHSGEYPTGVERSWVESHLRTQKLFLRSSLSIKMEFL